MALKNATKPNPTYPSVYKKKDLVRSTDSIYGLVTSCSLSRLCSQITLTLPSILHKLFWGCHRSILQMCGELQLYNLPRCFKENVEDLLKSSILLFSYIWAQSLKACKFAKKQTGSEIYVDCGSSFRWILKCIDGNGVWTNLAAVKGSQTRMGGSYNLKSVLYYGTVKLFVRRVFYEFGCGVGVKCLEGETGRV